MMFVVCKIPEFPDKRYQFGLVMAGYHTFLETRHPEGAKNPYYRLSK